MIVREAYRDVTHSICRAHYNEIKPAPNGAPALGPVEDARDLEPCEFCALASAKAEKVAQ